MKKKKHDFNTRVNTHLACPSKKQKLPYTLNLKSIHQLENFRTLKNSNSWSLDIKWRSCELCVIESPVVHSHAKIVLRILVFSAVISCFLLLQLHLLRLYKTVFHHVRNWHQELHQCVPVEFHWAVLEFCRSICGIHYARKLFQVASLLLKLVYCCYIMFCSLYCLLSARLYF